MRARTQFAKSGDVSVAYQVTGSGPPDLVYVPGWLSNVEYAWENPIYANFLTRLAAFSRLIRFDKRGTGMSDREVGFATLEERMDDIRAVMDAVGCERAGIYGTSEGGLVSVLFAATYPERTNALILGGGFPKFSGDADYPWRRTREQWTQWLHDLEKGWGGPFDLSEGAPSVAGDARISEWFAAYLRFSASPKAAIAFTRNAFDYDVREFLPTIQVPTLVLHAVGDRWCSIENGRYLAKNIPNATLVELPGEDHIQWAGDRDRIVDEIQHFMTGVRAGPAPERTLMTVLMTDIAESTATAAKIGDARWRHLLEQHNSCVRQQIPRHGGKEVNYTGDGFLIAFEGPTKAIYCAEAIRRDVRALGIPIRAGIHTGECERRGDELSGMAVHIAARIMSKAEPDAVWTSSTVKDLVVGSGIRFSARGAAELKGVPGQWALFSVDGLAS
jgi:pimeloyl-ACP methyl ester carboxylesterase